MGVWKCIDAEMPPSGSYFVLIAADGSGAGYYFTDDNGTIYEASDGDECSIESIFMSGGLWTGVPADLATPWFMQHEEPRP